LALVIVGTVLETVPPFCTAIGSWRRRPIATSHSNPGGSTTGEPLHLDGATLVSTVWISIVAAIGAFSIAGWSIYLGYNLLTAGSVATGLVFALFGAGIAGYALYRLIGRS
jgi:hypothetical protein